jgi:lipid-A-disaccharide synthase-like uncharacterized protein
VILEYLHKLLDEASWWDVIGWTGQAVFGSRFLVQWLASERKKESVVPVAFWYLSIIGSLLSLAYAITTHKLPFIAGYTLNCIPYIRNLMLIYAKRGKAPAPEHVCEHCGKSTVNA